MQSNLKSLFAGKREVVEVPPKRGPGRPPKLREPAVEEQDEVLKALAQQGDQPEAYDERMVLRVKKESLSSSSKLDALSEAAGKTVAEMRMPGSSERRNQHEGPQVRLALCEWMEKSHEAIGGSDEAWETIVLAVAEKWGVAKAEVLKIVANRSRWQQQCEERGVTSVGLKKDQAHLPRYLRTSMRGQGTVCRAKGGGRVDKLRFLYPLVKDFFETMRLHGKYIDAQDLEDYLQGTMQRYVDEASKPEVVEALEDAAAPTLARIEDVKSELTRLRDPKVSSNVHKNRQEQLMRFCDARLRRPQRLTTLTLAEERARWQCTLQAYDRLLWEAMRPEFLKDRVINPEEFVEGVEDTVVCHADQVPCWLRIGSQMQLYRAGEVRKRKRHEEATANLSEQGAQVQVTEAEDGMAQSRQNAKGEGDRFRVTLEMSQLVLNVFKPGEKPEVRHGRLVLVVPGAHARLSNISEAGVFVEDEVFMVKGKQRVRKKGTAAGNLMLSWRQLRDQGDEDMKGFFGDIEVMQQPAAFCDGVIVAWIAEMRKKEGYEKMISVRDMFAGGLSQSVRRMSFVSGQLMGFIAGKMTPVLQLTDVAVAFGFKKVLEAVKHEVRRSKRGEVGMEAPFREAAAEETSCSSGDLMRILGLAWRRMRYQDEVESPDRLLRAARACGWLSYRADPVRKVLVRCDEEPWMAGRADELPEASHRHPAAWWAERYRWVDEAGVPREANWKSCGRQVFGMEYMRDEFPAQAPAETMRLNCMLGTKVVTLPDIDLSDEAMTFGEVAKNVVPQEFLRTQREKFEAARMRALTTRHGERGQAQKSVRVDAKVRRNKMKKKLLRKNKQRKFRPERLVGGGTPKCLKNQ